MQQACGGAAVAASATGTKVPASANNTKNRAVRRCIVMPVLDSVLEHQCRQHKTQTQDGASSSRAALIGFKNNTPSAVLQHRTSLRLYRLLKTPTADSLKGRGFKPRREGGKISGGLSRCGTDNFKLHPWPGSAAQKRTRPSPQSDVAPEELDLASNLGPPPAHSHE